MNVGAYLVSKSPLSSGTALAHLLALQTGTGQGTVFASMFSVRCDAPSLTLVQRAKRGVGESAALRWPRQVDARDGADAFVLTGDAGLTVGTARDELVVVAQRAASVFVRRDVQSAAVLQSDVVGMTNGE